MWSALQSRQVAGVTLAPPYSFRADAMKFSRLVDTYDKPYQNTGVVVRKDRIHKSAGYMAAFAQSSAAGKPALV